MSTHDPLRDLAHRQPGIATYAEMLAGGPSRAWVPLRRTAVQPATVGEEAPESPRPQGGILEGPEALSGGVIDGSRGCDHIVLPPLGPHECFLIQDSDGKGMVCARDHVHEPLLPDGRLRIVLPPPPPRSWLQALIRRFRAAKPEGENR